MLIDGLVYRILNFLPTLSQLGFHSTPSSSVAYLNFRMKRSLSSRLTFDSIGLLLCSLKSLN